jgi:hypothetical protein
MLKTFIVWLMLLAKAQYGNDNYMLKDTSHSFVSSLTGPHGTEFAVPSGDPEDSLPTVSSLFLVTDVAPPLLTSVELMLTPPDNHTWWHIDTSATEFCLNHPLISWHQFLPTNLLVRLLLAHLLRLKLLTP